MTYAFREAADGRYEIVDADGEIVRVYDRLGHALHHAAVGHPTAPSCCAAVNRLGDVLLAFAALLWWPWIPDAVRGMAGL